MSKEKQTFITKMILFLFSSLIAPITYLSIRFDLFTKVTKTTLSFWAILVIALVIAVVSVMIKYYISGLKTRYTLLKQVLEGVVKVIFPLALILVIICVVKANYIALVEKLDLAIECVAVILGCETIAIFVNPLPKWAFDNNVEGLAEITNKLFKKGETE